jgi:hypothetical protein
MEDMRNAYKTFVRKTSRRKISLRRLKRRWEDNITNEFRETECKSTNWVQLAMGIHDSVVRALFVVMVWATWRWGWL